jgi:hypothetical protein
MGGPGILVGVIVSVIVMIGVFEGKRVGGGGVAERGMFGVGLGVAGAVHAMRTAMRRLMIIKLTIAGLVNEPTRYCMHRLPVA